MDNQELQKIKERAKKAIPGPWVANSQSHSGYSYITQHEKLGRNIARVHQYDNAEFMAAAREDVPRLVWEVERLQLALQLILDTCEASEHIRQCTDLYIIEDIAFMVMSGPSDE